jgi:riboflavin kinase/FMN adenylyltransferase
MNAKRLICGYNFTFGRNGSGNADTLRTLFPGKVCVIPCVSVDGEPVSSTAVRRLISSGNLLRASVFLGRFYSISGTVIRGRGDGSRLGFPTANIIPPSVKLLPPPGVYVTTAELDGKEYRAVTDAGYAPTVDSSDTYRLETHVPGLSGDLYGKPLTVRFIDKIRDEKKYESESELVEAIRSDIGFAESYLLPKSR